MKPIQSAGQTLALPRQFSRIFGKLRNLPPQDGLAIAYAAYAKTDHPQQRNLAMRLRIRLLQEHYASLHATPDQPEIIEAAPPPPVAEVIAPRAEIIPPPPPVRKKQPKMMMMNLENNDLSAMMDALSDPSEDAV